MIFRIDLKERWIPLEEVVEADLFSRLQPWAFHFPAPQLVAYHMAEIPLAYSTKFQYDEETHSNNVVQFPNGEKVE